MISKINQPNNFRQKFINNINNGIEYDFKSRANPR